jgi:hypothetical protein
MMASPWPCSRSRHVSASVTPRSRAARACVHVIPGAKILHRCSEEHEEDRLDERIAVGQLKPVEVADPPPGEIGSYVLLALLWSLHVRREEA